MKTPHPHKDLICQWAEDTSIVFEILNGRYYLASLSLVIADDKGLETFRIKPKMISLNGFEYPEPLSSAPPKGTVVWTTWVRSVESIVFSELNESAMAMLKQRRLHLTREAAEMHFEAIIKAGGGEV
jgi:hypothetical protein